MQARTFIAILLTASVACGVHAKTVCIPRGGVLAPESISWDTQTRTAQLNMGKFGTFEGSVTLIRKHMKGYKVNMIFPHSMEEGELEYIVFPIAPNKYRVIGVGYINISGSRFLDTGLGEYNAMCSSK